MTDFLHTYYEICVLIFATCGIVIVVLATCMVVKEFVLDFFYD